MWIISKARLREFWEPGHRDAQAPLSAWHQVVRSADWSQWSDVTVTYRSADQVGDCVVFNIAGNKYRLIARIRYASHKVYVLKVMTHAEYSRRAWIEACGCHSKPPARKKRGT